MQLTVGSTGPVVTAWQRIMVARFQSYALAADGGPLRADGYFGYDDADVQREYERRTNQPVDGIVSEADLVALGVIAPPAAKPTLFTVHGTGVTMWDGPPADTARAVLHKYHWQPIGNYPAQPFPMWPSIQLGVAELRLQINRYPGPFALAGYSQGAIVTSLVYKYDIANPRGILHHRLKDLKKAVTWGNPMAEHGASPNSTGIMDDRLENTPTWWRDYCNKGDIYCDNPSNDSGEYSTAICKIVMGHDWWRGRDSIISQIIELGLNPIQEGMAMLDAIVKAGLFFANGTSAHLRYDITPAINYLKEES